MIQGPLPRGEAILELLNSQTRALHAREIAARLHVEKAAYPSLLRVLSDLATTGVISPHSGQRFRSNPEATRGRAIERVPGVLRRRGKALWLEPDDTRVRGPIVLAARSGAFLGEDGQAAVARI